MNRPRIYVPLCPSARYVPRADLDGYRPEAIADGSVRAIDDVTDPAERARLAAYHHRASAAYPRGFSVTVEAGLVTGGLGAF